MTGSYKWTCTACPQGTDFYGETAEDAQQQFFDHVQTAHPKALVVSIPPRNS